MNDIYVERHYSLQEGRHVFDDLLYFSADEEPVQLTMVFNDLETVGKALVAHLNELAEWFEIFYEYRIALRDGSASDVFRCMARLTAFAQKNRKPGQHQPSVPF
jgi:hypothetical protein